MTDEPRKDEQPEEKPDEATPPAEDEREEDKISFDMPEDSDADSGEDDADREQETSPEEKPPLGPWSPKPEDEAEPIDSGPTPLGSGMHVELEGSKDSEKAEEPESSEEEESPGITEEPVEAASLPKVETPEETSDEPSEPASEDGDAEAPETAEDEETEESETEEPAAEENESPASPAVPEKETEDTRAEDFPKEPKVTPTPSESKPIKKGGVATPLSSGARTGLKLAALSVYILILAIGAFLAMRSFFDYLPDLGEEEKLPMLLHSIGKALAMMAIAIFLINPILSARLKIFDKFISYDRLIFYHILFATIGLVFVSFHPLLVGIEKVGLPTADNWPVQLGFLALLIAWIMVSVSLFRFFLGLPYGAWLWLHRIGASFVMLAVVHAWFWGGDFNGIAAKIYLIALLAALIVVSIYKKGVKPIQLKNNALAVGNVRPLNSKIFEIEIPAPEENRFEYLPGQFAFLTLKRSKAPVEEHPFTISSTPTRPDSLIFTIKNSGDYTSTIGKTREGDRAIIDGPFGHFSHLVKGKDKEPLLFIAGGIGITPLLSMMRYIADNESQRSILLIWANRSRHDIVLEEELTEMAHQNPNMRIVHVLSDDPDWDGEKGFVDRDFLKRVLDKSDKKRRVFLCGPPPMMKMTYKALKKNGFSSRKIHTEEFSI
ncbi:MAG: ferric reductase-like transmembrane domain-containing protein [Candidatus Sumerlaeia bacterium]